MVQVGRLLSLDLCAIKDKNRSDFIVNHQVHVRDVLTAYTAELLNFFVESDHVSIEKDLQRALHLIFITIFALFTPSSSLLYRLLGEEICEE